MSTGEVALEELTKKFGDDVAVDGVDLRVSSGEFFSLLGPSGCGKTTTLRMVAGFETPTSGRVVIDGQDMKGTPPARRPVNTVFQSYALFPHLRVFDNVAFGLRRQRIRGEEMQKRVSEALDLVELSRYARHKPGQLSGGQQQRVALARALVLRPAVLLLDEPLGALDAKLRRQLQVELKELQSRVKTTFIYVTHDQEEALSMSDQVAVMNHGRVVQVATPRVLYEEPGTAFVADFLGLSNVFEATVGGPSERGVTATLAGGTEVLVGAGDLSVRGPAKVIIRPERIRVHPAGTHGPNHLPGMVTNVIYHGSDLQVLVHIVTAQTISVSIPNTEEFSAGDLESGTAVVCELPPTALRVLTPESPAPGAGDVLVGEDQQQG